MTCPCRITNILNAGIVPTTLIFLVVMLTATGLSWSATHGDVQARMDADIAAGKSLVIHVIVALCDNANQGIIPVPEALGNGQNPATNLYWGARYGVRTHLPRSANWNLMDIAHPDDHRILERIVLYAQVQRKQRSVPMYMVAEAWNGAYIREALTVYLEMAAGRSVQSITLKQGSGIHTLKAGGASHLVVYIGHNGLMEFNLDAPAPSKKEPPAKSAMVLACASRFYFIDRLRASGAHPLLLTTGLMAPEAYTLDSAIRSWVSHGTTESAKDAAAEAYNRYQKCGLKAAQRLFWGEP